MKRRGHKKLDSKAFLNDICYIGVALDRKGASLFQKFIKWLYFNCNNGMIKPIIRKVFNADKANEAFRYMTTGQHIGKIVIKLRDEEINKKQLNSFNSVKPLIVKSKTYFDPNKSYIISGGLGGMGLELVHWMLYFGARKFVLTSRQGFKNNYQKFIIKRIECFGKQYESFKNNILISTQNTNSIEGTKPSD